MPSNNIYLFDFDNTFIQGETLEILAEIALANHPEKKARLDSISEITRLAMEGHYSFQESLRERFALLPLTMNHILQAIEIIKQRITPSIERNKDFFKANSENIYIISGAFIEIVWPIVHAFGIKRAHVFANHLLYDFENNIHGFDTANPLSQDQGKVKLASQLKLEGNVIIIGDGYNDYELKEAGYAQTFLAFTENIAREAVMKLGDGIIDNLDGLFITCDIAYHDTAKQQKVLLLENIHPDVAHYFHQLGYEVEQKTSALHGEELKKQLQNVSVLGIRSKSQVTKEIIAACPSLESIGAFCIGTNQIDVNFCTQQGVAVFNAPFSNTRSVVELAIAEIILLLRRAASSSLQLAKGHWHKSATNAHEVRGKILGIIGYGNIGSQLSILAEAMGMQVVFYDIEDKLALGNAKVCSSMENLLAISDVVSLHVDGRQENQHLINDKAFSQMKHGAIFLNLSRDFIVDYDALRTHLQSGKITGVGIDVFPNEPSESKCSFKTPLTEFDNILLTPHIGGSTEEAQAHIGEYVSKNCHAFMIDGSSVGSVNFPQLSLPTNRCAQRIIHIHQNVPGILAQINSLFAKHQCNIEGQSLKTNDKIGYVITDLNQQIDDHVLKQLQLITHTIKVKILDMF